MSPMGLVTMLSEVNELLNGNRSLEIKKVGTTTKIRVVRS